MLRMRTTLTLQDGLAARLKAAARKKNLPFKQVVHEALRKGLDDSGQTRPAKPFKVEPVSMGARPGIDFDKINQVLDEAEAKSSAPRKKRRAR